ncbi:MAG: molybdopterin-dependent oxidoreductase [SAR324 cluster bacterium]|nr:molybdopterin-dependent oxidoreductase [SAR324 cluster bacterium]MCH8885564.1 molybdopterin-dependent oxidoreductase [SAR324 cluster bacterium]
MQTTKHSVCTLDCPDTCSLLVTVEEGRVISVRGSDANPLTGGVLCNKVTRYYPEFLHGEGRLTTPLKRIGAKGEGRFEPISWEEALDTIHARFSAAIAAHGPQSIMPLNYAGPHGMLAYGSMDLRFFHKLGASLLHRASMCGGIRSEAYAATFGKVPGSRPEQLAASRLIVVWGNNVTWTNLHLMPLINEARREGAKLVVVDPRRTKVAEQADLHLAVLPGTDVVLAYALAAEMERNGGLDEDFIAENVHGADAFMEQARAWPAEKAEAVCGVPAGEIRQLARWYQEGSPAAISVGNGLERNRNGGSSIRAIFALPALAGKFGVRGGGVINGAGNSFPKTPARLTRPDLAPPGTRTLNLIDTGRYLTDDTLDPPIKAVFIYNHNPLIVHPDQNRMRRGLAREDLFTVGCDLVMTDSLAYADIVLPAASQFESGDLYPAYGQQWLQRAEAVIPPVADSLPHTEIFRRLAARFGFDDPIFTASDAQLMDDAVDPAHANLQGRRPSEIPLDQALEMTIEGDEAVLFANVRPSTPSGKVELSSEALAERYGQAVPEYRPLEAAHPLTLITPASDRRITSTFGGLRYSDGTPPLEMHPSDAEARGLTDGATVRVWNALGEVRLPLRITEAVRPGVVCSLKGAWMRTSDNGQTVSALAPSHHADLAGGACYNDARVEVAAFGG